VSLEIVAIATLDPDIHFVCLVLIGKILYHAPYPLLAAQPRTLETFVLNVGLEYSWVTG
jgi:hypothetical protein